MNCECKLAGWCERHSTNKTDRMVELCRQGGKYWDGWESGRFQAIESEPVKPSKRKDGPGTQLKKLLSERGYSVKSSGCGCNDKASKMNSWGVDRCREKIDEIVGWLEESARKAGWLEKLVVTAPLVKGIARKKIYDLVNEAIDRADSGSKRDQN